MTADIVSLFRESSQSFGIRHIKLLPGYNMFLAFILYFQQNLYYILASFPENVKHKFLLIFAFKISLEPCF